MLLFLLLSLLEENTPTKDPIRSANDVFHLVDVVTEQLSKWDEGRVAKLDILINNAAQTLTDSINKENEAVLKEQKLIDDEKFKNALQLDSSVYKARIRGGLQTSKLLGGSMPGI